MTAKDYQSDAALLEDGGGAISEAEKEACRRVICANAKGDTVAEQLADAELLMDALGIHPRSEAIPHVPSLRPMPGGHGTANTTPPRVLQ